MNTTSRRLVTLGAALSLAVLPACSPDSGTSTGSGEGGKLKVVTAFYPLQYVTQQVAGDKAEVTSLTAPGAEPHETEPTPQQIAELGKADLVVYERGFQSAVDKAVDQAQPKNVVDVATYVQMMESTAPGEEGGAGAKDPHTWLVPANMTSFATAIDEKLGTIDSANKAGYDSNTQALKDRLTTLDKSFATGLKNCQRKDFITSHAAFGYLAKAYGLNQIGISGLSPDEEPSPARVAEVQKLAAAKGVTTIFYETLVSPAQAKAIAGDMGLKTDVLDPIEGITEESRGKDYIAVQESNLKALQQANGCQ